MTYNVGVSGVNLDSSAGLIVEEPGGSPVMSSAGGEQPLA